MKKKLSMKTNNPPHYLYGGSIRISSRLFLTIVFTLAATLTFNLMESSNVSATYYTVGMSTSGSVTVDINSTSNNNGAAVASDNITVTSTCPYGYTVSISGPSDRNLYKNGDSSNNTAGTYISPSSGTTSSPATITGANLGTWGYSLTSSTTSGTFIGLPSSQTTLTSKNSASASGGDNIPVYYGVSTQNSLAPGQYKMTGTSAITYYLTTNENCFSYQVSFNANGGSGTAMSNQRIYEGISTPLSANTYTAPSGKIFAGWNTAANGSGTSYTDQQSVTDIATPGTTLPLYAQWITPIYMQDMSFSECTTTPMTVYDKRDMKAYTVTKLADGNCWMTTNLNLAGGTALSADDTDVKASYISSFATGNNLTKSGSTIVLPASSQSGFSTNNYSYVYNSPSTDCSSSTGCYGYYSWDAVTLGSGRSISTDNTDAPYSICPKGWKLPTSRTTSATNWQITSNFYALAHQYGLDSTTSTNESDNGFYTLAGPGTTPNFLLAGYYDEGSFSSGGSYGYYWSATSRSSTSGARSLNFDSSTVDSATNDYRSFGTSVRCMKEDPALYKKVEKQSKGTQTASGLQATISASNSGVYQYNSSAFGADTDGTKSDNTKANIYYYRGILDNTTGTYGSNGDGAAYPNYVILDADGTKTTTDTCWRIIRTTGSGGVKMIYNGTWTGSTCANATTAAMISSPASTSTFDGAASNTTTSRQIVRVGYTYNGTYANTSTTTGTTYTTVMGSNSNYSVNSTDSTIKGNVETWFNNTLSDFNDVDMFEPNAGYCNDRLGYTSGTGTTLTTSIRPYTTSTNTGATYNAYFAGYQRNNSTAKTPSLGCSSGRNVVDIYSTDTSAGGNGQLSYPVALLTADEASFAGSGSNTATNGSTYNANSFLRNGSTFWTMTPYYRYSRYAYNFYMNANGYMQNGRIDTAYGIRPVVSLIEGTAIDSGAGTATNPWVITIPEEEPDPVPDPISCASNKICYAPNSYDNSVVGTMGQQSANASTETMLLASNFSREGYGFAGWNTKPDYSGNFYGPQETITTPSDMSSGLPLYAVWVKSKGYLQNASKVSSICSNLTTAPTNGTANLSSVSALTDQRDNETYAIAKLADGQCWMIENLRLDSTAEHNSDGTLAQGYGTSATYGNFSGLADAESVNFTDNTTANSLYYSGTQDGTASIDIGTTNYPGYRFPRYNNTNTSARASTPITNSGAMYSYGNYYTWHAAIADLTYNGTDNQSTTGTSLCPTGWHLPQGGNKTRIESNDDNDFWNLTVDALNGGTNPANYDSNTYPNYNDTAEATPVANKLRSYPNNFLYSGIFNTWLAGDRGSLGYYWSSTTYNYSSSYFLHLYSSRVFPGTNNGGNKGSGRSIRCTTGT